MDKEFLSYSSNKNLELLSNNLVSVRVNIWGFFTILKFFEDETF